MLGLFSARVPDRLRATLPDPWPVDMAYAEAIVRGADPLSPGLGHRPDPEGFDWLRDLGRLGTEEARKAARYLIRSWIGQHARDMSEARQIDVLATRVVNWIGHHGFLCEGADNGFRDIFADGLTRQLIALDRIAKRAPQGIKRIAAARALISAGACLPRSAKRLSRGIALVEAELAQQILPDGGYCDRNPSHQLEALRLLIDIRAALAAAHADMSEAVQNAIDRMAPMLRFFRHGDGGLALFNGGQEETASLVDLVLQEAEAEGKAPTSAPHSGFQRLTGGSTTVVVDCGRPPIAGFDRTAHAGTLSFEMSSGAQRLIVNCGAHAGTDAGWRQALRATAAHSTLTVRDTNSAEILPDGGIGRRPEAIGCRRNSSHGAIWLDLEHDGYRERFGLVHQRRLYLTADGGDLRGEDRLAALRSAGSMPFAIRFHLHPSVTVHIEDETPLGEVAATLRAAGQGSWRFLAAGGSLAVEESAYFGRADRQGRTRQLVVSGETEPGGGEDGVIAAIKWAIKRTG